MTRLKYLILLVIVAIFSSCIKPETTKTIDWNGNTFTLSVINGGATTSYLYKIEYKRKWIFGRERLIFWSYSTPTIKDISIENNKLLIHCLERNNQPNNITIDLKNINQFIGSPVKYRRSELVRSNAFYIEPDFIKQERQ